MAGALRIGRGVRVYSLVNGQQTLRILSAKRLVERRPMKLSHRRTAGIEGWPKADSRTALFEPMRAS